MSQLTLTNKQQLWGTVIFRPHYKKNFLKSVFVVVHFHGRSDTHPPDRLFPPRPGTAPPILTWPAPTPPGIATVPGNSLPISSDTTEQEGDAG